MRNISIYDKIYCIKDVDFHNLEKAVRKFDREIDQDFSIVDEIIRDIKKRYKMKMELYMNVNTIF